MSFVALSNLLLSVLCIAVIVQTVRMIRRFNALKKGDLGEMVKSLDRATGQARQVLGELKEMLATDGAASIRTIQSAEDLREELSVMIGIGNSIAERIVEASSAERAKEEVAEAAPAPAKRGRPSQQMRARRAAGGRLQPKRATGDEEEFKPAIGLMAELEALATAHDKVTMSAEKY
ncbi:DUF6468 domain-containing protein [Sphingomonas quercus]|uniref:DUF6468 domain-containing protein n=1 Tax=Sphingomonas quercus TaxID=2842451 RepID=A0ABS6BLE8_9SPHN|nr:DUF6468 domain-containing protein [Sphingomonas quercus]MBU3078657.1 hypothetical protein [Sphingomonas quercus]